MIPKNAVYLEINALPDLKHLERDCISFLFQKNVLVPGIVITISH